MPRFEQGGSRGRVKSADISVPHLNIRSSQRCVWHWCIIVLIPHLPREFSSKGRCHRCIGYGVNPPLLFERAVASGQTIWLSKKRSSYWRQLTLLGRLFRR